MPSPTARLLELLELLQSRPRVTGEEISRRLGTDRRTVRRDVAALQEIGIPVEGFRGVGGGYALQPGYRMPPLMLTADEAVAVLFGLGAARRAGLGDPAAVEGADRKLRRVLPAPLAERVGVLARATWFTGVPHGGDPPDPGTALLLAEAVDRRVRAAFRYAPASGAAGTGEREVSPHGLVVHRGRWYLAAFDHGREAARTFRVDRVRRVRLLGVPATPPPDPDVLAHVSRSLARVPWGHEVEVVVDLPPDAVARRLPPTLAELAADGDRTVVTLQAETVDWAVGVLAGLGVRVEVRRPEALRTALRAHAARLADC